MRLKYFIYVAFYFSILCGYVSSAGLIPREYRTDFDGMTCVKYHINRYLKTQQIHRGMLEQVQAELNAICNNYAELDNNAEYYFTIMNYLTTEVGFDVAKTLFRDDLETDIGAELGSDLATLSYVLSDLGLDGGDTLFYGIDKLSSCGKTKRFKQWSSPLKSKIQNQLQNIKICLASNINLADFDVDWYSGIKNLKKLTLWLKEDMTLAKFNKVSLFKYDDDNIDLYLRFFKSITMDWFNRFNKKLANDKSGITFLDLITYADNNIKNSGSIDNYVRIFSKFKK